MVIFAFLEVVRWYEENCFVMIMSRLELFVYQIHRLVGVVVYMVLIMPFSVDYLHQ